MKEEKNILKNLREENKRLQNLIEDLNKKLMDGRSYLMQVDPKSLTVEDALQNFGFGRNGLSS